MKAVRPKGVWLLGMVCSLALLVLVPLSRLTPRGDAAFRNVAELQAWAEGHGLYCRTDREDGRMGGGLALATRPLGWVEVMMLPKGEPTLRPIWRGVVWAMNRSTGLDGMPAPPWEGECRVWGGVIATGDPALLDRIEKERVHS